MVELTLRCDGVCVVGGTVDIVRYRQLPVGLSSRIRHMDSGCVITVLAQIRAVLSGRIYMSAQSKLAVEINLLETHGNTATHCKLDHHPSPDILCHFPLSIHKRIDPRIGSNSSSNLDFQTSDHSRGPICRDVISDLPSLSFQCPATPVSCRSS